jgi:hypothetical protein
MGIATSPTDPIGFNANRLGITLLLLIRASLDARAGFDIRMSISTNPHDDCQFQNRTGVVGFQCGESPVSISVSNIPLKRELQIQKARSYREFPVFL